MEDKEFSLEEKTSYEKDAKKRRAIVLVTRLNCTTCALAIEKQVKKLKGVDDIKAAIMLNKVFIDYDPSLVDLATLKKAIDTTGYKSYMTVEEKLRDSND